MSPTVGLFPGQGSQYSGMGRRLAGSSAAASLVFDRAEEATGINVRRLCWNTLAPELDRTENAQLALTVFSLAAHSAFEAEGQAEINTFAGHSVGAIAAAAAAGYLSVESAASLAAARGRLMAGAPGNGGMIAVAVSPRETAEESHLEGLKMARSFDLDIAAHNGPRQIVLSGQLASVDKAVKSLGAKAKKISVSHGFHSRLMAPVNSEWHEVLDNTDIAEAGRIYIGCTDGRPTLQGGDVLDDLKRGLCNPVMWSSVMEQTHAFKRLCVFGSGRAILRLARPYVRKREVMVIGDNARPTGGTSHG
ncbi:ACP S-malonyltransferase [bacterium RCC_150]